MKYKILIIILFIFLNIHNCYGDMSQYYNKENNTMEIPLYVGNNYISYCSLNNTTLDIFNNLPPEPWDRIYKLNGKTQLQKSSYFLNYWRYSSRVEPIESGIGYIYNRKNTNTTWIYSCIFYCNPIFPVNETVKIYNSTLIIKNNLNNPKILVFENGSFLNEYSNIDVIELKNNTNYTIIINEKFIDIINKKHFLSIILIEYGYIIISLLGIIILCGIIVYVYKKSKGK